MSLPIAQPAADLHEWFLERYKDMEASDLRGKHAWHSQILFVRDDLHSLLVRDYEARRAHRPEVVSTHTSKSCKLPVYHIKGDCGIEIWLRGNFYNWQVSVKADEPVRDVFFNLFQRSMEERDLNPVYFEGFDPSWVFEDYDTNQQQFTVSLDYSSHVLWTFVYLLTEQARADAA